MTRLTVYCFVSLLLTAGNCIGLAQETVVRPVSSNLTFNNPLKGWCPYPNQIQQPCSMVFPAFTCPRNGKLRGEQVVEIRRPDAIHQC